MTPENGTYTLRRGDQSFGPYTRAELAAYLAAGNVVPADSIFDHDTQQWTTARSLVAEARSPRIGTGSDGTPGAGIGVTTPSHHQSPPTGELTTAEHADTRWTAAQPWRAADDPAVSSPPTQPGPLGSLPARAGSAKGFAIAALVLGILSVTGCGMLSGIAAIVLGTKGLEDPTHAGMARGGLILGIVGTGLSFLWLIGWVVWSVFA